MMIARFDATTTAEEIRELAKLGVIGDRVARIALFQRGDVLGGPSQCHAWQPTEHLHEFRCSLCRSWCRRDRDGAVDMYER